MPSDIESPKARNSAARPRRIFEGAAVFLVAVAAYANTLQSDFTLDDVPIIQENESLQDLGNIGAFFKTNYWGEGAKANDKSLYRPLTITSYALNYAVHKLAPLGYHVVNVLLHACTGLLLYALLLSVFSDSATALVAGVLFAVHPIHTEVVAGIVGRAEIMALFGGLWCALAYLRATRDDSPEGRRWIWVAVSVAGYAFGAFSKETGLLGPSLIVLWEIILPNRRRLLRRDRRAVVAFAGYGFVALIYAMLWSSAVQTNNINVGFIGVTASQRIWTALRVCMEYVGLLIAPIRLSADYWRPEVPVATGPINVAVIGAIALLAAIIGLIAWSWRRGPAIAWGLCVFLVVLAPVSNLFFRIGVLKAERILYSPSAGFIVAMAAVATAMFARPRARIVAQSAVWLLAMIYLGRTVVRNNDWRDNCTLARVTLQSSPTSPIFNTIMSTCYRQQNQNDLARQHLLRTLETQPDNTTALFNLGNIELDEKRFDEAIWYYEAALKLKPEYISVLNNLGRALAESGRLNEAVVALERSRQLRPNNPAAFVNLLSIYIQLKDLETAIPLAEEAQRRFPQTAPVFWNSGSLYLLAGRKEEAQSAYRRAEQLDPQVAKQEDFKSAMD